MNKQDFINKGWGCGTKISTDDWPDGEWIQIIFMGSKSFFAIDDNGMECSWDYDDDDWIEYKQPKYGTAPVEGVRWDSVISKMVAALTVPVAGVEWDTEHVKKSLHALHFQQEFCNISPKELDLILDWLGDSDYLSEKGKTFKRSFWELFIKE